MISVTTSDGSAAHRWQNLTSFESFRAANPEQNCYQICRGIIADLSCMLGKK